MNFRIVYYIIFFAFDSTLEHDMDAYGSDFPNKTVDKYFEDTFWSLNKTEQCESSPRITITYSMDNNIPAHNTIKNYQYVVDDGQCDKVRVLCLVLTMPENHYTKAVHVNATWGKRCNRLIFMSTQEDASLGAIKLNVTEGRSYLWGKTKAAFRYVYKHHRRHADWFFKADDDTYVILENLRYLLSQHDSSEPLYLGRRYLHKMGPYRWSYMTGGAGYVLSRAALRRLVKKGLPSPIRCKEKDVGAEDIAMGLCLERVGVRAVDTRDSLDRERFFQEYPLDYSDTKCVNNCPYYPVVFGINGSSDSAVSFHHITPEHMLVLEYLVYRLRAYDIEEYSVSPYVH